MRIPLTVTILLTVAYETHLFACRGLALLKELTGLAVERGPNTTAAAS